MNDAEYIYNVEEEGNWRNVDTWLPFENSIVLIPTKNVDEVLTIG